MESKYIDLAKKVLLDSEELLANNTDSTGSIIIDKNTLKSLTMIIQEGLLVYNYLIDNNIHQDKEAVLKIENDISKISERMVISDENAKNLNLRDAMINWTKMQALIISLCVLVIELEAE